MPGLRDLVPLLLLLPVNIGQGTSVPLPPGASCAQLGPRHAHTFVALAWSSTCECTDPAFPPQSNGSHCLFWIPTAPCAKHPVCGTNKSTGLVFQRCKTLDNVAPLPRMLGITGATPFGDTANLTAHQYLAALEQMPAGHHALLLHDLDQGMNGNPSDDVLLPPEAADCADTLPPGAKQPYNGGNPAPPPLKAASFSTIWWDASALQRRYQSIEWFAMLKQVGGHLDMLAMDSEETGFGWKVPPPKPYKGAVHRLTCTTYYRMSTYLCEGTV